MGTLHLTTSLPCPPPSALQPPYAPQWPPAPPPSASCSSSPPAWWSTTRPFTTEDWDSTGDTDSEESVCTEDTGSEVSVSTEDTDWETRSRTGRNRPGIPHDRTRIVRRIRIRHGQEVLLNPGKRQTWRCDQPSYQ